MSGVIKVDFQTIDSIDLESIENPELREKIRKLKEDNHTKSKKTVEQFESLNLDPKQKEEIIEHLKRSFAINHGDESEPQSQNKKSNDED